MCKFLHTAFCDPLRAACATDPLAMGYLPDDGPRLPRLSANIRSDELVNAFAKVPRENFLGPGPWKIASVEPGLGGTTYVETPDANPRHLYHSVPVALDLGRDLNNGQPAAVGQMD